MPDAVIGSPSPSLQQPAPITPTPTPTTSLTSVSRLISAVDGSAAVRVSSGSCGVIPPSVELTVDGGETWTLIVLPPDLSIGQVSAAHMVTADQVDLVVLAGVDCRPSVLSTFTGGQFWELYPDRLGSFSYFDPSGDGGVDVEGAAMGAPCPDALEVVQRPDLTAVRCSDGIAVFNPQTSRWEGITPRVAAAVAVPAVPTPGAEVLAAFSDQSGCEGTSVDGFAADGSTFSGDRLGCAPIAASFTSLASASGALWLWADDAILVSADNGVTWIRH
ncbi:hypothetical protein SAMN05216554_0130 [Herbiconiux ginsengi]|uniref:Uncharacterized protein n=1 Tax=Herbiconiux ginsengi TaxID=381665 RepID=A0A1H3U536_9MICO|nr:hypothetical protein SAMN05216554_0130 [Herbiconiux ginsengi]